MLCLHSVVKQSMDPKHLLIFFLWNNPDSYSKKFPSSCLQGFKKDKNPNVTTDFSLGLMVSYEDFLL